MCALIQFQIRPIKGGLLKTIAKKIIIRSQAILIFFFTFIKIPIVFSGVDHEKCSFSDYPDHDRLAGL